MPSKQLVLREQAKQLSEVLSKKPQGIDSKQLLVDIIDVWGGTRAFVSTIHSIFHDPKCSLQTKQRLIEMIQRLIINVTDADQATITRPSDMSNEELQQFALGYFDRVKVEGEGGS